MQKQRESNPVGIVVISAIITIFILGGLSYLFIFYVIPLYQIDTYLIYTILIRLLPVVIGFTLVLLAVAVSPTHLGGYDDYEEPVLRDIYTEPLFTLPNEEYLSFAAVQASLFGSHISQPTYPQPTVPVEGITPYIGVPTYEEVPPIYEDEYEEDIIVTEKESPSSHVAEEIYEEVLLDREESETPTVEKEQELTEDIIIAQKEVVEPLVEEVVDVTQIVEEPPIKVPSVSIPVDEKPYTEEIIASLEREVSFDGYPYDIEPHSNAASLLEPIKASSDAHLLDSSYFTVVKNSLAARLQEEMNHARAYEYPLSLIAVGFTHQGTEDDKAFSQFLYDYLSIGSFAYYEGVDTLIGILPFYNNRFAHLYAQQLIQHIQREYPFSTVSVGHSTIHRQNQTDVELLEEVASALTEAKLTDGFHVVSYKG
ncbi:MAG: hypothetical protein WCY81_00250 [Sphaerochaetaceae bacterium]